MKLGLRLGVFRLVLESAFTREKLNLARRPKPDFESPNIYSFVGSSIVNITIRENKRPQLFVPQFWDNSMVCVF